MQGWADWSQAVGPGREGNGVDATADDVHAHATNQGSPVAACTDPVMVVTWMNGFGADCTGQLGHLSIAVPHQPHSESLNDALEYGWPKWDQLRRQTTKVSLMNQKRSSNRFICSKRASSRGLGVRSDTVQASERAAASKRFKSPTARALRTIAQRSMACRCIAPDAKLAQHLRSRVETRESSSDKDGDAVAGYSQLGGHTRQHCLSCPWQPIHQLNASVEMVKRLTLLLDETSSDSTSINPSTVHAPC